MENSNELLDLVITAHGGLERWKRLEQVKLYLSTTGYIWEVKGHEGALSNVNMTVNLQRQGSVQENIFSQNFRATFEPRRVATDRKTFAQATT